MRCADSPPRTTVPAEYSDRHKSRKKPPDPRPSDTSQQLRRPRFSAQYAWHGEQSGVVVITLLCATPSGPRIVVRYKRQIGSTDRKRVIRSALDSRVVCDYDTLTARYPSNTRDDTCTRYVICVDIMGSKSRKLKKRCMWVKEQRYSNFEPV